MNGDAWYVIDLLRILHTGLHCCDETTSPTCRDTCRRVLVNMTSTDAIISALDDACDDIMPHGDIWKCFLMYGSKCF